MTTLHPDVADLAASVDPHRPFVERHIGPLGAERDRMLAAVGYDSLDALMDAAVPADIRLAREPKLPEPVGERGVIELLTELAEANTVSVPMIGLGYSPSIMPGVIQRNVLENPAWYTAYTPYQAEISQGRLAVLLSFQTLVEELTGLPVANASVLDEATAAAEAMALAHRTVRGDRRIFLVDEDTHPQTIAVMRTRAEPIGLEVRTCADPARELGDDVIGVLASYPGSSGQLRPLSALAEATHAVGALLVVASDPLALVLVSSPGDQGADLVVGSMQRYGMPLSFGGPHAGFLAARTELVRQMPGRIVGVSVDADGDPGYRLSLQAREQHIRREKATSNICTAQALPAMLAALYATYHGPDGLAAIASTVHRYALLMAETAADAGIEVVHDDIFDTVRLRVPGHARSIVADARDRGVLLHLVDDDTVQIACSERTTFSDIAAVAEALGTRLAEPHRLPEARIPAALTRRGPVPSHPLFATYRSETAMLRYLRRLADEDLALDRTMIPLGSCTMKLNATAEMAAITWPGFADIHPFAPGEDAAGYHRLISELEDALVAVTGYAAASLQPNAGSQGEFAGLLAIRAYHAANGGAERDVCLIPSSAHGTNAASAAMVGFRVVVVACRDNGDIDRDDLSAKLAAHEGKVAAMMITYPSTHGVYESHVRDIIDALHGAGGQVYVDGANLNALVGWAAPGAFGADVSHLNLHKTFCIPHGGGGPGVGPVAVAAHLAPHLPNHPLDASAGPSDGVGPVSAAPFGSAGVLPISWAYLRLMGASGVAQATATAVLAANYIAVRLRDAYPVLYTGASGLVAHECILDLRGLTKDTGITAEDVAKRLIDYGFHAPTLSFPVAGTLMVEPTESEDLTEIDRFIDAMLAIRAEIDQVASGELPADDNPLVNAPHTATMIAGEWDHAYTRDQAAFPVPSLRRGKYWPPVRRIDGAAGDRNLVCSCPPPEAYE